MSDSNTCLNARALLAEIEPLKKRFDLAYERGRTSVNSLDKEEVRIASVLFNEKVGIFNHALFFWRLEQMQIAEQYASQVAVLKEAKFAYDSLAFRGPEEGGDRLHVNGIDAQKYTLPTLSEIISHMGERSSFIRSKIEQGFTRLLLVPFALSSGVTLTLLKNHVARVQKQHVPAFPHRMQVVVVTEGGKSHLYESGFQSKLIYNSRGQENEYIGRTKEGLIADVRTTKTWDAGWRILLVRPDAADKKKRDWDFERMPQQKLSTNQFLARVHVDQELGEGSPYYGEEAMILEDWMVDLCTNIKEADSPLADREAILPGSHSMGDGAVPRVHLKTAGFMSIGLDHASPETAYDAKKFCTVVRI